MTYLFILLSALSAVPDKDLHEKCLYPTVMIVGEKPKTIGSGVIVKSEKIKESEEYESYVITCAHILIPQKAAIMPQSEAAPANFPADGEIVQNNPIPPPNPQYKNQIRVGIYENWSTLVGVKEYPCEVLFTDREKDTALIRFKSQSKMPVAEIDKKPALFIGNDVLKVGCGLGEPFRIDYGKITSVKNSIGNMIKGTYRISAPTIMGDSGGPVFHENKVIGVSQALRNASFGTIPETPLKTNVPITHMVYVVPIETFLETPEIAKYIK